MPGDEIVDQDRSQGARRVVRALRRKVSAALAYSNRRGDGEASSVEFLPCQSPAPWLVYAGGFSLKKRGCVPFDVQVGDRVERIRIAFGRACISVK